MKSLHYNNVHFYLLYMYKPFFIFTFHLHYISSFDSLTILRKLEVLLIQYKTVSQIMSCTLF